jgi:hypothetical protein
MRSASGFFRGVPYLNLHFLFLVFISSPGLCTMVTTSVPVPRKSQATLWTTPTGLNRQRSSLLLLDDDVELEDVCLGDADFPPGFMEGAHKDDYKPGIRVDERTYHRDIAGHHHRALWRISWKIGDSFYPMTFILDTGAPKFVYLNKQAMNFLQEMGMVHKLPDVGLICINIRGKACLVQETPQHKLPANLIGLPLLRRWQFALRSDEGKPFTFDPEFEFLSEVCKEKHSSCPTFWFTQN